MTDARGEGQMNELESMKERILAEAPRLGQDDEFSFRCHPGISCFNRCCADVNIVLTPYDLLRLRRRLALSSTELIERYTLRPFTKDQQLPVIVLRMDESKPGKPCLLVTDGGCSVYEDRPWPCRMYPIGCASARTEQDPHGPEFFFLMREEPCDGFAEGRSWTIREWLEDQGLGPYDEMGELFKEITLHPHFRRGGSLNPQQMEMFYTVCYDLDRFRSFVFESTFLERYEVEPEVVERMRTDDEELLRFGFRWLKSCLFNMGTVALRPEAAEQIRARQARQAGRGAAAESAGAAAGPAAKEGK